MRDCDMVPKIFVTEPGQKYIYYVRLWNSLLLIQLTAVKQAQLTVASATVLLAAIENFKKVFACRPKGTPAPNVFRIRTSQSISVHLFLLHRLHLTPPLSHPTVGRSIFSLMRWPTWTDIALKMLCLNSTLYFIFTVKSRIKVIKINQLTSSCNKPYSSCKICFIVVPDCLLICDEDMVSPKNPNQGLSSQSNDRAIVRSFLRSRPSTCLPFC